MSNFPSRNQDSIIFRSPSIFSGSVPGQGGRCSRRHGSSRGLGESDLSQMRRESGSKLCGRAFQPVDDVQLDLTVVAQSKTVARRAEEWTPLSMLWTDVTERLLAASHAKNPAWLQAAVRECLRVSSAVRSGSPPRHLSLVPWSITLKIGTPCPFQSRNNRSTATMLSNSRDVSLHVGDLIFEIWTRLRTETDARRRRALQVAHLLRGTRRNQSFVGCPRFR